MADTNETVARLVTREDWETLKSRPLTPAEMSRYPGPMHEAYAQARLDDLDRIVRREIIAELLGAADEWDAMEAKGYDPLSPAEIAGNLRARVQVIRNG